METFRLAGGSSARDLRMALAAQRAIESHVRDVHVVGVMVPGPAGDPDRLSKALRDGAADAVVLSASEMPLYFHEGVVLAALLEGRDAAYRCVSRSRPILSLLLPGARVAATDAGALAQLRAAHPLLRFDRVDDIESLPERLRHGEWTAACLPEDAFDQGAFWGLRVETMDVEELVPPAGQGAIAILTSRSSMRVRQALGPLGDPTVHRCVSAERAFVREAGDAPGAVVAAHATVRQDALELLGLIAEENGRWLARDGAEAESVFGDIIAREVAESCRDIAARRSHESLSMKLAASF